MRDWEMKGKVTRSKAVIPFGLGSTVQNLANLKQLRGET